MNKHIELVKKWLTSNKFVTLEELETNEVDAGDANRATPFDYWPAWAAYWAARAADDASDYDYCKNKAIEAVKKYEELSND